MSTYALALQCNRTACATSCPSELVSVQMLLKKHALSTVMHVIILHSHTSDLCNVLTFMFRCNRRLEADADVLSLPPGVLSSVTSSAVSDLAIATVVSHDSGTGKEISCAFLKYSDGHLAETLLTQEMVADK